MTEGCYHIENSPLICSANQWTGFYMITASVMKGLMIIWSDRKKRQLRRLAEKGHVCYMQLSETY